MDEKSRIQAATILQGIVKGYMNPVRHMSADDENYEKWMRLVERMDQEYAKDPFFEEVMDKYTGSGVVFSENLIKAYRQAYCQAA